MKRKIFLALLMCALALAGAGCAKGYDQKFVADAMAAQRTAYDIRTTIKAGELESSSRLRVGKRGETYVAEYVWSRQRYEEISADTPPAEAIRTETGRVYYDGEDVGKLVGETVEWKTGSGLEAAAPSAIGIKGEVFRTLEVTEAEGIVTLTGMLKADSVEAVLGEGLNVTEVSLTVRVVAETKEVRSVEIDCKSGGAPLSVEVLFGYELQNVILPDKN